jgi:formylglycine-generating enzyme required for sulfatase activity
MTYYILHGGGWFNYAGGCRVSNRLNDEPGRRISYLGFRLIKITKS